MDFTKLEEAKKTIEPFEELWNLVSSIQEKSVIWINTLVRDLDPDEIEREAKQMHAKAKSLLIRIKEKAPKIVDVVTLTIADIEKFMKNIPAMKIVSTRGLENRHFEKICKILGKPIGSFKINSNTKFKELQKHEIESSLKEIEEVALLASREFSNLRLLEKMEREWDSIKFELKERPDVKSYIHLGSAIEIIQTLFEDQILTIQTLKRSPYAAVYFDRISS